MAETTNLNRRSFIKATSATCIALSIPTIAMAAFSKTDKPIKIGLLADLHQDVMHDGKERLSTFLKEMKSYLKNNMEVLILIIIFLLHLKPFLIRLFKTVGFV